MSSSNNNKKEVSTANRVVFFFGGLTARMGYKQQTQIAKFADHMFYIFFFGAYALGWYLGRFSITLYGVLLCGLICLAVMVPNWSSAIASYKAGKIVSGLDELNFLPNKHVRKYYEDLRKDEVRVDPKRNPPSRFNA